MVPFHSPIILPHTPPGGVGPGGTVAGGGPPQVNIPLKYYGYVRRGERAAGNRGFFLDGDNVLVASEGDVLKSHYLVVELTPTSARMEDTQMRQGQTLPVVQAATTP